MDYVAVSDCYNSFILCWYLGADGYHYVVCNPTTQKFKVLLPSIHSVGEGQLGFDSTASSHFHVSAWLWISTHLKLQHGSIRNLNGVRILLWHFQDQQLCFFTVVCTLWDTRRKSLRYLLWIGRERHGEKFLGHVGLHLPSIKLRVTCIYVLLVVAIGPNFQSGSLKTMVLIYEYWSIRSTLWRCLGRLTLNLVTWMLMRAIQRLQFTQNGICLSLLGLGRERAIVAYNMHNRKVYVIPTHYIRYGRRGVLPEFIRRPYCLPYVTLFSKSLAEE
jgi:hypothetical protein